MDKVFSFIDPLLLMSCAGGLILFALVFYLQQAFSQGKSRSEVKKRLTAEPARNVEKTDILSKKPGAKKNEKLTRKVADKANDFYANSDPNSVKKLRMMLIQAGYMNPGALGYFIAARFASAAALSLITGIAVLTMFADKGMGYKLALITSAGAIGYFIPNFFLNRKMAATELANRQGFPDILDLMVVSAEAGLTMEASIEKIAGEIKSIYPNLSMQLNMAAVEIRAGRPIDQALRAFGERLRLDEVKGFATMVQQAKELGTSVSDALRVYSDEMRHKRMMKAEEKAYALPAKMSIPVTVFILPIVIGIAIIPTIVRWN
ncbi:MAG: type II secretion system F family protein [Pseudomonadota bacterium]